MDDSLNLFKEYFRDIYTATSGTCAGACDEATPAKLGPAAYEIRRCCKSACSEDSIKSLADCDTSVCEVKCRNEVLVNELNKMKECLEICELGCRRRFQLQK
jgi:hypothetical protein